MCTVPITFILEFNLLSEIYLDEFDRDVFVGGS